MKHDVFSRCSTCTSLTHIVENGTEYERAVAEKRRDEHWRRVTIERRNVCKAHYESQHDPDFLFCEIDGMDSAKTILPHFHTGSKAVDKEKLLKLHVTCVKYNGMRPDDVYYFTDTFPHDSANTCTVMYKTLLKV